MGEVPFPTVHDAQRVVDARLCSVGPVRLDSGNEERM